MDSSEAKAQVELSAEFQRRLTEDIEARTREVVRDELYRSRTPLWIASGLGIATGLVANALTNGFFS